MSAQAAISAPAFMPVTLADLGDRTAAAPAPERVTLEIRPIAIGRSNWLFAGSLRAGQRAAAIMSLLHAARINGHEPCASMKDVLERLPTHPASRIDELLPHRWMPAAIE